MKPVNFGQMVGNATPSNHKSDAAAHASLIESLSALLSSIERWIEVFHDLKNQVFQICGG